MDRIRGFWRRLKIVSFILVIGFTAGHLEAAYLTSKDVSHIISLVRRGACGQDDLDGKLFWYNCRDSVYADLINPRYTEEQKDSLTELVKASSPPKKKK